MGYPGQGHDYYCDILFHSYGGKVLCNCSLRNNPNPSPTPTPKDTISICLKHRIRDPECSRCNVSVTDTPKTGGEGGDADDRTCCPSCGFYNAISKDKFKAMESRAIKSENHVKELQSAVYSLKRKVAWLEEQLREATGMQEVDNG